MWDIFILIFALDGVCVQNLYSVPRAVGDVGRAGPIAVSFQCPELFRMRMSEPDVGGMLVRKHEREVDIREG